MDIYIETFSLKDLIKQLCAEQSDLAREHTIRVDVDNLPDAVDLDKKILTWF